jgi:hypothetical protein
MCGDAAPAIGHGAADLYATTGYLPPRRPRRSSRLEQGCFLLSWLTVQHHELICHDLPDPTLDVIPSQCVCGSACPLDGGLRATVQIGVHCLRQALECKDIAPFRLVFALAGGVLDAAIDRQRELCEPSTFRRLALCPLHCHASVQGEARRHPVCAARRKLDQPCQLPWQRSHSHLRPAAGRPVRLQWEARQAGPVSGEGWAHPAGGCERQLQHPAQSTPDGVCQRDRGRGRSACMVNVCLVSPARGLVKVLA